jgi:glycosyltransferase involved in cell wall biosynthesis
VNVDVSDPDQGRRTDGPSLCCYIPSYTPDDSLGKALQSIASSSLKPYVLIVDDASQVAISVSLLDYGLEGEVIRLDVNQGVAGASNEGLRRACEAGFEHIARLDSDDMVLPERFAKQLAYLECHPDKLAVFTTATLINEKDEVVGSWPVPDGEQELVRRMALNNVLCQSSGMFRREFFTRYGFFDPSLRNAEDYQLYFRPCLEHTVGLIAEPLVKYRLHGESLSFAKYRQQLRNRLAIQARHLTLTRVRGVAGLVRTLLLFSGASIFPRDTMSGLRRRFGMSNTKGSDA